MKSAIQNDQCFDALYIAAQGQSVHVIYFHLVEMSLIVIQTLVKSVISNDQWYRCPAGPVHMIYFHLVKMSLIVIQNFGEKCKYQMISGIDAPYV